MLWEVRHCYTRRIEELPFCPDSLKPWPNDAVSKVPPMECIELAVDPLLGWYLILLLLLEPGLRDCQRNSPSSRYIVTNLGKGYSLLEKVGELGEKLSVERRGVGEAMITMIFFVFPALVASHTRCAHQRLHSPTFPTTTSTGTRSEGSSGSQWTAGVHQTADVSLS